MHLKDNYVVAFSKLEGSEKDMLVVSREYLIMLGIPQGDSPKELVNYLYNTSISYGYMTKLIKTSIV